MRFENAYIPYRAYWSTPFCRWQGSFSGEHPMKLAASCATRMLASRNCAPARLNGIHFGMSVPQQQSFWGAPWIAAMIGADHITGPTISQACATSARVLASAAAAVELGSSCLSLALATDRTSNGPHIYYPDPTGPGGRGSSENWVWDNINCDPYALVSMVQTAENIATRYNISRAQQDDLTVFRFGQYQKALANDRAFQRGYMQDVEVKSGRATRMISTDEGIIETTLEGIARLKPVIEGGSVTYAGQTHPADGNAGLLVCSRDESRQLSADHSVTIQMVAFGEGRAEKGHGSRSSGACRIGECEARLK
jgi:acetyl-CoA acetyltransferase